MNATELVAAIRSEHYLLEAMWGCSDPRCCGVYDEDREDRCAICGTPWPCLSSVAADRIEAAYSMSPHLEYAQPDGRQWTETVGVRAALDGES